MASRDISRDDLLILLASMGVVFSGNTQMSVENLSKRLGQAFDASQQFSTLLNATPIDLDVLPLWSSGENERSLYEASNRGNLTEDFEGVMRQPKKGSNAPKKDTFKEMRQSVLGLAYASDEGASEVVYKDNAEKWALFIRILEVRKIKDGVPLFVLEYKDLVSSPKESLEFLVGKNRTSDIASTVSISALERQALLKLLKRNATKLHPKHRESTTSDGKSNKGSFQKSFVLPLCPLNMVSLGKLTDPGCVVCGEWSVSRCVQCLSVAYCGKECQRIDWPTHKAACRSLKGGTWHTIDLSDFPIDVGPEMKHRSMINRLDTFRTSSDVPSGTDLPKDAHNGKIFLAKFQAGLVPGAQPQHMMIYDRQRSFQSFWRRESDRRLFDSAVGEMRGMPKFYRWVKMVGPSKMEVCLDRGPKENPVW